MDKETFTLPPQTTCAKCEREIVLGSTAQDRFRYEVIEVRDLLTNTTRYYHHPCYNQQMKNTPTTKGR